MLRTAGLIELNKLRILLSNVDRMRIFRLFSWSLLRSWIAYGALPLVAIITAPILARALGPVGRGQLAGMLQPLTLASAIASLGVPAAVTYFVGRGYSTMWVVKRAIVMVSITTLVVGVALFFYSPHVAGSLNLSHLALLGVWAAFIPSAFIAVQRSKIQGLRNYLPIDQERLISSALRVGMIVSLWTLEVKSVFLYAAAYMISGLLASTILYLGDKGEHRASTAKPEENWSIERYAVFASFGTIAMAMSARLDQAILPSIVRPAELGYFSVAVAIAEVANIITMVIARNLMAEVSSGVAGERALRLILVGGAAHLLLDICLIIALPWALPAVFGEEFRHSTHLVFILLISNFLAYWASCGSTYLSARGQPGKSSFGPAAGALATALSFAFFWASMSSTKAAWISVLSQSITLLTLVPLCWLATKR